MKYVTYYTHEGSDVNHYTRDTVALVLAENEETGWADLAVFPVGGPVTFCRVYAWNDDALLPPPGGNYWRDEGSDPPDFSKAYRHYTNEQFQNLLRKQQEELTRTAAKDHAELLKAQKEEQNALLAELDGDKPDQPEAMSDAERVEAMAKRQREKEAARAREVADGNRRAMEGRRDA